MDCPKLIYNWIENISSVEKNRGSYMNAHVLLNLLHELGKSACRAFYCFFAKSLINLKIQEHEC